MWVVRALSGAPRIALLTPAAATCGLLAGKIVSWLKGPGDKVKKGESIVVSSSCSSAAPAAMRSTMGALPLAVFGALPLRVVPDCCPPASGCQLQCRPRL